MSAIDAVDGSSTGNSNVRYWHLAVGIWLADLRLL